MSEEKKIENGEEEKVELDAQTYGALLDRLDELEEKHIQPMQPPVDDDPKSLIDELADEGKKDSDTPEITPPENLDTMSNTELLNFMVDVVNKQAGPKMRDMEVKFETLRVLREIDKAESKYDDFWRYEGKIKELSMANPSLNIEQAYKLARAENPPPKGEEGSETPIAKRTTTEKILNLPPRTAFGEKPSVASGTTTEVDRGSTMKDAGEKAWEEAVGKDKNQI